LLSAVTGTSLVHIPYKGGATPMTDLISGQIPMLVEIESILAPQAAAGKLHVLAITGPARSTVLPDVPTMSEAGIPDFVVQGWLGIVAPRGIEPEIIDKLNNAIRLTLSNGETIAALARGGATVRASSAAEFGGLIESEALRWSTVVRHAGIQTR
jgi:tripartite-type tricarboxylate transporter receptor subunit TctC